MDVHGEGGAKVDACEYGGGQKDFLWMSLMGDPLRDIGVFYRDTIILVTSRVDDITLPNERCYHVTS